MCKIYWEGQTCGRVKLESKLLTPRLTAKIKAGFNTVYGIPVYLPMFVAFAMLSLNCWSKKTEREGDEDEDDEFIEDEKLAMAMVAGKPLETPPVMETIGI